MVWASLALGVFYSLDTQLTRCRTDATVISCLVDRVGSD
jgi:hypothetical protein